MLCERTPESGSHPRSWTNFIREKSNKFESYSKESPVHSSALRLNLGLAKFDKLSSLRQYLLAIFIILVQNISDFTETNRAITNLIRSFNDTTINGAHVNMSSLDNEKITYDTQLSNQNGGFKISATKLRLFNGSQSREPKSFERTANNLTQSAKSDCQAQKWSFPRSHQVLVPAYEFVSLIRADSKNRLQKGPVLFMNQPEHNNNYHAHMKESHRSGRKNGMTRNGLTQMDILRNSLPRPSETRHKSLTIRSASDGHGQKIKTSNLRVEEDPNSTDEEDIERSDSADERDPEEEQQNDLITESLKIDYRDSDTPIYPPGNSDILYSDALLVYVKDFNQYIK